MSKVNDTLASSIGRRTTRKQEMENRIISALNEAEGIISEKIIEQAERDGRQVIIMLTLSSKLARVIEENRSSALLDGNETSSVLHRWVQKRDWFRHVRQMRLDHDRPMIVIRWI